MVPALLVHGHLRPMRAKSGVTSMRLTCNGDLEDVFS